MMIVRKSAVGIFVDRARQQWIVRDPDGNYWSLPSDDAPWDHRRPFDAGPGDDLEPVPGHYRTVLGLPF